MLKVYLPFYHEKGVVHFYRKPLLNLTRKKKSWLCVRVLVKLYELRYLLLGTCPTDNIIPRADKTAADMTDLHHLFFARQIIVLKLNRRYRVLW